MQTAQTKNKSLKFRSEKIQTFKEQQNFIKLIFSHYKIFSKRVDNKIYTKSKDYLKWKYFVIEINNVLESLEQESYEFINNFYLKNLKKSELFISMSYFYKKSHEVNDCLLKLINFELLNFEVVNGTICFK